MLELLLAVLTGAVAAAVLAYIYLPIREWPRASWIQEANAKAEETDASLADRSLADWSSDDRVFVHRMQWSFLILFAITISALSLNLYFAVRGANGSGSASPKLESMIEATRSKVDATQQQVAATQSKVAEAQSAIGRIEKAVADLKVGGGSESPKLEALVEATQQQVAATQSKVAEAQSAIDRVETAVVAMTPRSTTTTWVSINSYGTFFLWLAVIGLVLLLLGIFLDNRNTGSASAAKRWIGAAALLKLAGSFCLISSLTLFTFKFESLIAIHVAEAPFDMQVTLQHFVEQAAPISTDVDCGTGPDADRFV